MTDQKIRVILADDHSIVLEGLRYVLSKQSSIEIVATAGSGLAAVELAEKLSPDIVILDLKMPGLDGCAAAERILEKNPAIRIIALSANISSVIFHRALKAGISSFVDKESLFEEIVRAINEVADGHSYHCPRVRGLMAANLRQALNPSNRRGLELSASDRELIAMLTDGQTVGQIAITLKKSPKTIDARRRKIMQQLGLSSLAELTKYAISEGITSPELMYS